MASFEGFQIDKPPASPFGLVIHKAGNTQQACPLRNWELIWEGKDMSSFEHVWKEEGGRS